MKWDKICIMLPTYGRSDTLLPKFLSSCIQTAGNLKNLRFAFCVNWNDEETIRFIKAHPIYGTGVCKIVRENLPSPHLAKYFNMLYDGTKDFGDDCLVSMLGDDMSFKTPGWDTAILNQVNWYNGGGVHWCNDDYIAKERLCVNMFVTRQYVEATEHSFMDETFPAEMIDLVWYLVGKQTKHLHYLPDFIIKHDHNTAKPKEQWDKTFNRLRPYQMLAHGIGKQVVRENAERIAAILIKKGYIGDNA
jgi:hypothetical protein